jgi:hypothetical protein
MVGFERQQGITVGAGATGPGKLPDKKRDERERKHEAEGQGEGNDVHGEGRE